MVIGGTVGLVLITRDATVLSVIGVAQSHIHLGFT